MHRNKHSSKTITKVIVGMFVLNAILIMVGILTISGFFFYSQVTSVYDDMDRAIAGEAATQLDITEVQALAERCHSIFSEIKDPVEDYDADSVAFQARFDELQEMDGYRDIQNKLIELRAGTTATEIDMVLFYPDRELGVYIMDARDVELVPCGELFQIDGKYFEKDSKIFKGFYSDSRFFGRLRTNGVPIYVDETSGIYTYLTVDIQTSLINSRLKTFALYVDVLGLALCAVISILVTRYLRKQMVEPITSIADLADSFVAGYEHRASVHEKSSVFRGVLPSRIKEIRELLASMQSMELEMNSYIENLDSATREQERIRVELDMASAIQAASLPKASNPFPDRDEFTISASMTPAKEVGGDFYDFFLIDRDHLGLVMADVSGKGVPAALYMMVSRILIQNLSIKGASPSDILEAVNRRLCSNNREDMFVTVWLGILTISTGRIVATNAGHEYPIIRHRGGSFTLFKDKHCFVLGAMEDVKYSSYEFTLGKGDTLFLYTDGVPEAINSSDEMFGTDRMLDTLNRNRDLAPAELLTAMKASVNDFVGAAPAFDDMTMLAIRMSN